jgi:hypothetical protein
MKKLFYNKILEVTVMKSNSIQKRGGPKVFFDILDKRRKEFIDKVREYMTSKGIIIRNSNNRWKCDFWIPRESVEFLYPNDKEGVAQFLGETINHFWIPVSIQYKTIRKKDTYVGNLTKIIIGRKYTFGKLNIRNCFERLVYTNQRTERKVTRRSRKKSECTDYYFDSIKRRQLRRSLMNYMNITSTSQLRRMSIFIDFETITDFQDDLIKFPEAEDTSMIFMIGVGYYDKNDNWCYHSFITDSLKQTEEEKIICEFYNFLEEKKLEYKYLVHWSHAEPVILRKIKEKWGWSIPKEYSFLDLMQPFRLVYNNQSVALKKIAGNWMQKGYIKTDYSTSDIADGLTAMAKIVQCWDPQLLEQIRDYNRKDTEVLAEIMSFLFL